MDLGPHRTASGTQSCRDVYSLSFQGTEVGFLGTGQACSLTFLPLQWGEGNEAPAVTGLESATACAQGHPADRPQEVV